MKTLHTTYAAAAAAIMTIVTALLLSSAAGAQESGASLRGQVVLAEGQSAADYRVTASHRDGGYRRTAEVRDDGSYIFPALRTGGYRLELAGPDGVVATEQLNLLIGQNAVLTLAADSAGDEALEEVIVYGQAVKTLQSAEVGLNVTTELIDTLPQNSRNFLAFADLAPGVSFERGSNGATRIQGGAQRSSSVNVFIDGVGQKDYVLKNGITGQDSSQGNPFPQSAIGEYRVISQNYKAEFDQVSSAAITAVTRSGTNEFHGDIFWDFTNDSLRAKTPREIELDNPKVETEDNQFGVSLGGPILRDRLHFFVAYEGKRNETPVEVTPGGGVDIADLPAQYQSLVGVFNREFEQDLVFAKLDYFASDRDLIQFSVKVREEEGLRWDNGVNTGEFSHAINNDETRAMLRYERTGDDWTNDVRVTYEDAFWSPQPDGGINASFLNLANDTRILNVGGHPNFQRKGQEGFAIQNDFTWIGFIDHVVKTGIKVKWVELSAAQQLPFNPQYFYNTEFDPGGVGPFNDQVPYRVEIGAPLPGIGDGSAQSDNVQFGIYIQDDWQVTDRLELSFGLRWDYEETPVYLDYVTPADVIASLESWVALDNVDYDINDFISTGNNRDTFDSAFAPRLGFSYDLTESGVYTLFGGYGRSYDRTQFDFIRSESSADTFRRFQFNFDIGDPDHPCPGCPAWDPIYLTEEGRNTLLGGGVATGGRQVFLINNDLDMPYADQFSLGIRGAWDFWDGEVGVTHVRSRDGFAWLLGNRRDDGSFFAPGATWGSPFGFTPPGFGNLLLGVNGLESDSNSVYVKASKPYDESSGWGLNVTYTFTDAEENRKSGETFSLNYPSLDDYPVLTSTAIPEHRLVAAGSLDLPWGLKLSGKFTYESPEYIYGIGRPGDPNDQRVPRVKEAADDFQQWDLALVKYFDVGGYAGPDGSQLRLRIDVLNVFDHANIDSFVTNGQNDDFAEVNTRGIGGNLPRTLKLSIGYNF
ncbi:MAG: TonB-dependent receptor [Pseudomonadota bacterium]